MAVLMSTKIRLGFTNLEFCFVSVCYVEYQIALHYIFMQKTIQLQIIHLLVSSDCGVALHKLKKALYILGKFRNCIVV